MNCRPGDRALLWRNSLHPGNACRDALVGRVVVTVNQAAFSFGELALVWFFDGPAVKCPLSEGGLCHFNALPDQDLKPLPPESECLDEELDMKATAPTPANPSARSI